MALEDMRKVLTGYYWAIVHAPHDGLGTGSPRPDDHLRPGELESVLDQVGEDLAETVRVSFDPQPTFGLHMGDELYAGRLSFGPETDCHRAHDICTVDALYVERELPGVQPGQVEKVLNEAFQPLCFGPDDLDRPHSVVSGSLGESVRITPYRGERGPQLVRYG